MHIRDWLTNMTKSATCSPPACSVYFYMQCTYKQNHEQVLFICAYLATSCIAPFKAELLQASVIYASVIFLLFSPTSLTDFLSQRTRLWKDWLDLSMVFLLQDVTIFPLCGVLEVRTFLTCLVQLIFLSWELLLVLLSSLQLETFWCNQLNNSSTVSRLSSQGKWQCQSFQQIPQKTCLHSSDKELRPLSAWSKAGRELGGWLFFQLCLILCICASWILSFLLMMLRSSSYPLQSISDLKSDMSHSCKPLILFI